MAGVGSLAHDLSVFGMMDVVGGVMEWALDGATRDFAKVRAGRFVMDAPPDDYDRRRVFGGHWLTGIGMCALDRVRQFHTGVRSSNLGLRLVRPWP